MFRIDNNISRAPEHLPTQQTSLYPVEIEAAFANKQSIKILDLPEIHITDNMLSEDSEQRLFPHNIQTRDLYRPIMRFTWGDRDLLLGLAFRVSYLFQGQEETGVLTAYQADAEDRSIWRYHLNSQQDTDDSEDGIYNPLVLQLYFEPHRGEHQGGFSSNNLPTSPCDHCPEIYRTVLENIDSGIAVVRDLLLNQESAFTINDSEPMDM